MIIEQLIQRTQTANSLPVCSAAELIVRLDAWAPVLRDVSDAVLLPAWERAVAVHDWAKSPMLKPGHVVDAAHALIVEDRERREREAAVNRYKQAATGTFACPRCDDTGYLPLMVHCGAFVDWRRAAYPCECAAAPIGQRRPWPGTERWKRDRDSLYWQPPTAQESVRCTCLFCKNRGRQ